MNVYDNSCWLHISVSSRTLENQSSTWCCHWGIKCPGMSGALALCSQAAKPAGVFPTHKCDNHWQCPWHFPRNAFPSSYRKRKPEYPRIFSQINHLGFALFLCPLASLWQNSKIQFCLPSWEFIVSSEC